MREVTEAPYEIRSFHNFRFRHISVGCNVDAFPESYNYVYMFFALVELEFMYTGWQIISNKKVDCNGFYLSKTLPAYLLSCS